MNTVRRLPQPSQMADRRRGARYRLDEPGMGSFRIVQDVEIIHLDAASAVVAGGNIPAGERLLLDVPGERGALWTRLALAIEQLVRIEDDELRREVRLKILPRDGEPVAIDSSPVTAGEAQHPVIGAVIRRVPVRIVEISVSGCVWETPVPLDDGTVGFVEMQSVHGRRSEAVRLLHSSRLPTAVWQYRTAAEFLTVAPPPHESLRGVATMMTVRLP